MNVDWKPRKKKWVKSDYNLQNMKQESTTDSFFLDPLVSNFSEHSALFIKRKLLAAMDDPFVMAISLWCFENQNVERHGL